MKLSRLGTFVAIPTILLVSGCAGVKTPPQIIFQNSTHLVRIDLDRDIGGPDDPDRHTHPIDIGTDQLHTILDSTRTQEYRAMLQRAISGSAKQIEVFSEHDITVFAPQIREAFLQATPEEHVIFALINPVGSRQEITSGEMFVKTNTLHLILNCFQLIATDNSLSSLCGPIRQQEYDLSFTEKDYFIGFGNEFFGNGKKEIIIDYASIPSSVTPLTARMTMHTQASSPEPIEPMTLPVVQTQIVEREDTSGAVADHVTNIEPDRIQMLERKIDALTQVIDQQRDALEQQPVRQQSRPPRILFLTTTLMRGDDVTALQRALSFPSNRIDGIFGKQTDRAVRAFQKQHGMPVDGKVGHDIINALR